MDTKWCPWTAFWRAFQRGLVGRAPNPINPQAFWWEDWEFLVSANVGAVTIRRFGLQRRKFPAFVCVQNLGVFSPFGTDMPQLNGGGGDDLGANDELISFKDEGEQEEKISENVSSERDLDDLKSSLVNESENNSSSSDSEVSNTSLLFNMHACFEVLKSVCSPMQANRQASPTQTRPRKLRETEGTLCGRYSHPLGSSFSGLCVHCCTLFTVVVLFPKLCGDSKMEDFSRDPRTLAIRSSCSRTSPVRTSPTGLCPPAQERYVPLFGAISFLPRRSPLWRHRVFYINATLCRAAHSEKERKLRRVVDPQDVLCSLISLHEM